MIFFTTKNTDNSIGLKTEYFALISKNPREQEVQEFLEKNTYLIPREFIQNHGLHFNLCIRKAPMGSDYICDFMYLSKSTVQWNCVLIEIEKPTSRYFGKKGEKFHHEFNSALQQINDWRSWFRNQGNKDHFISNAIGFLKTPITHTPIDIKYVLVHGRRSEIENNQIRVDKVYSQQRDDFRIMSFDSLAEDIENRNALFIGVKKKYQIEIQSDELVCDGIFS